MGAGLTLVQYEPSPSPDGTPTTPNTGTWPAGAICCTVFASYAATGAITDRDTIGVDRSSPAAWSNIVMANNDRLHVQFNPGTAGAGGTPEYGMRYCLAYQNSATPNWANAWTIVAQSTNPFATTLTAAANTSLGTITLGAASTTLAIASLLHLQVTEPNVKVVRGYTEKLVRRSLVNRAYAKAIEMTLPGGALAHSEWSRIGKWASNGTRVRVIESEWSDPEQDAPIRIYEGVFVPPTYLNSLFKNRFAEYPLTLLVESTTPSSQVP